MLAGRAIQPWDVLEMDLMSLGVKSLSNNEYLLLVVDKASRFPFGFPLSSKQADGVARQLLQLCLTFGVPKAIRCDGGKEFDAVVIQHLYRWLKADIQYGSADHPRAQGSVKRLGSWIQDVLSELCAAWPRCWDEYVSPACWIKRTLPDTSLPGNMSPFELLFGRKLRTTLDTLVPRVDDTELSGGLDAFIEHRRQMLREVRQALEKRHRDKLVIKIELNAQIARPSAGISVKPGDLVLVREAGSNIQRHNNKGKLEHEKWTGP